MVEQKKKLRLDDIEIESFVTDSYRERTIKAGDGSFAGWVCGDLPGDFPDPDDFCSNGWGSMLGSPCNYTDPGNTRDTVLPSVDVFPPAVPGTNGIPCFPLPPGGGGGTGSRSGVNICICLPFTQ